MLLMDSSWFRGDTEADWELCGPCQLLICVTGACLVMGRKTPPFCKAKLFAYELEELSTLQQLNNRLRVFREMMGETVVYSKQNLLEVYSRKKPQRPFACRNSKSATWKPGMKKLYFSKIRYRVETVLFKYHRQQIFKSSVINGIKDR